MGKNNEIEAGRADEQYMRLALVQAGRGCGFVNPNPMVGAVIVKDGRIIGEGFHVAYGRPHAERAALAACSESPAGATLYVTLEPCCHHGKTPPCTDALIESGLKKVVVGCADPNPLAAGKGIGILRRHGIEVAENVLEKECRKQNEVFFHYIQTGTPYVVMKYAMTADGKIASRTGKSKWITGEAARRRVHGDRSRYAAIMIGSGTLIADDPLLTCRLEGGVNPVRIICDTGLKTPLGSQVVKTAGDVPTIIATSCQDIEKHRPYLEQKCQIMQIARKEGHLDLEELMKKLGQEKIDSVLLEGGAALNWSALQSGIVNKVQVYIAPKIFGGADAKAPVGGMGIDAPDDAFFLANQEMTVLGEDILLEYEVKSKEAQGKDE